MECEVRLLQVIRSAVVLECRTEAGCLLAGDAAAECHPDRVVAAKAGGTTKVFMNANAALDSADQHSGITNDPIAISGDISGGRVLYELCFLGSE